MTFETDSKRSITCLAEDAHIVGKLVWAVRRMCAHGVPGNIRRQNMWDKLR